MNTFCKALSLLSGVWCVYASCFTLCLVLCGLNELVHRIKKKKEGENDMMEDHKIRGHKNKTRYIYICIYTYVYTWMHIYINVHVYRYVYMYNCAYVTRMNESNHIIIWISDDMHMELSEVKRNILSHRATSHFTNINDSCHTYTRFMPPAGDLHMKESCHIHQRAVRVMSHTWTSHATRRHKQYPTGELREVQRKIFSRTWTSHVTHITESCCRTQGSKHLARCSCEHTCVCLSVWLSVCVGGFVCAHTYQ